jgi:hypothetical protein
MCNSSIQMIGVRLETHHMSDQRQLRTRQIANVVVVGENSKGNKQ